jgi:hypothetical protein
MSQPAADATKVQGLWMAGAPADGDAAYYSVNACGDQIEVTRVYDIQPRFFYDQGDADWSATLYVQGRQLSGWANQTTGATMMSGEIDPSSRQITLTTWRPSGPVQMALHRPAGPARGTEMMTAQGEGD